MIFEECIKTEDNILMEGALGERLRREYGLSRNGPLDMGAFVYSETAVSALAQLWLEYAAIAESHGLPFLATTPTRRTNRERAAFAAAPDSVIPDNMDLLKRVQRRTGARMYAGGLVGCRGDAYTGEGCLSEEESREFHLWEAVRFREAGADFLYAALMPTLQEAAGVALAIQEADLPYLISFTIQPNGRLVDGTPITDAIRYIDGIASERPPAGYMTNCVHPDVAYASLSSTINDRSLLRCRFVGLQANTASLPYSQLDGAAQLYTSDPEDLADAMLRIRDIIPIRIFGGCCGTTGAHMRAVAARLAKDAGAF